MEASFESRNTRRSATNLHHLTLAPLSSRLPIDAELDDSETDENEVPPWRRTSSYIQGKSAPTTPRILSRSSSRHRLSAQEAVAAKGSKSFTNIGMQNGSGMEGYYGGVNDMNPLSKSKSTTVLVKKTGRGTARTPRERGASGDDGEWLFRAGIAISSEARETKGQGWLVSRESSTNLVTQADPDGSSTEYPIGKSMSGINISGYAHAVDSVLHSNRTPRSQSRATSRPSSTHPSRRASRVGSKTELTYFTSTDAFSAVGGARTPGSSHPAPRSSMDIEENVGVRERDDYFGSATDSPTMSRRDPSFAGPDFVDPEELEHEEDEEQDDGEEDEAENERNADAEIAELARRDHGFGLGSVVDRMMNWTLFEVNEDGAEGDSDAGLDDEEEQKQDQHQRTQQRRMASAPSTQVIPSDDTKKMNHGTGGEGEEGGWKDAAWLLSVASKVLL